LAVTFVTQLACSNTQLCIPTDKEALPVNVITGLKQNRKQFILLVIVNAFVGGMIGMERTILPQFAALEFGLASSTAILSFIAAFGITKAIANYYAGRLANRFGRKKLLLTGWLLAIPVPFLLIYAPTWNWVLFANMLLGLSQGLAWSSTVVMKIDLVGPKDRGLAMGLNEFAGYLAIGMMAYVTGYIAKHYGLTPYPFYLGIIISVTGFLLTVFWVKDTKAFVRKEEATSVTVPLRNVFYETTLRHKTLSSVTQAGMINNLNDGMIWGLLPMVLASIHYDNSNIGIITAIYPAVWGLGQLFTGRMSDRYSKKEMMFLGMLLQGIAILFIPFSRDFYVLSFIAVLLGIGTALVYPTFLSAIAQVTAPLQRAESIGTFRFWRDLGYAFGALLSGLAADFFGLTFAVVLIGLLTLASSLVIRFRMPETTVPAGEAQGR
jgi:MFS family permease